MLASARRRFDDRGRARRGVRGGAPVRDAPSTTSRSRISSATSTTLARRWRSSLASSGPAAIVASLEFGVPRGLARARLGGLCRAPAFRSQAACSGTGWSEVGDFLGDSIRTFWESYPLERQLELWRCGGHPGRRVRRMSLGGGVVIWGPARRERAVCAAVLVRARAPAAGATTSRSSIRRTRRGTSPTS